MSFRLNKHKLLFLLFSLVTIIGCKDQLVESYDGDFEFKVISGDDQSGVFNGMLPDSIVVEVTHPNGEKPSGYKILATTEFGKAIDQFKTTENGIATFEWELGCGEEQEIQFWLYGTECDLFLIDTGDCTPFDSAKATANAIQEITWVKGCGLPNADFFNLQYEENNFGQYLLLGGITYVSTDNGLSWSAFSNPSFGDVADPYFVEIELNPTNNKIYGIMNDHIRYQMFDNGWSLQGNRGGANINSPLTSFLITSNNMFASFGSDGIFIYEEGEGWRAVSTALDFGEQVFKLDAVGTRVYGVLGSIKDKEIIYNTDASYTDWERNELPLSYFRNPFGDFMVLPDESVAIGSGISARLSEFFPISLAEISFNDYIFNNGLGFEKSIKDLNFYNDEIYFLGFDKNFISTTGSIFKGKDGNFEELDFEAPCNNIIFFDIRNDGSFIIGCEDGVFVFKQ